MKKVSGESEVIKPLKESIWVRSLLSIERTGNRLPAPALLFLYLIVAIIIISALCQMLVVEGIHPSTREVLQVNSLLSFDALRWWLQNAVKNFITFAPVGPVSC